MSVIIVFRLDRISRASARFSIYCFLVVDSMIQIDFEANMVHQPEFRCFKDLTSS